MLLSSVLLIALAQSPTAAPANPNAGAELNGGDVAPAADGGAPEAKKPGPDVSKMPFTEFSIKEIVKYHLPDIQDCYNGVVAEVGKNPPQGTVIATFSILANGLTEKVKADRKKSTIKNDRIQQCVTDAIATWTFPKPTDGREHPIEYPFQLKVQGEAGDASLKPAADAGSTKPVTKSKKKKKGTK